MKKKPNLRLLLILLLLLFIAAICLWLLDPLRNFGGNQIFHVSLGSTIFANYGSDQASQHKLNIVDEVIRDIQELIDPGKILSGRQTTVPTETIPASPTSAIYTMTPIPPYPTNVKTSTPFATAVNTASVTPSASSTLPGQHGTPIPTASLTITSTTPSAGTVTPISTPTPTPRGHRTFPAPTDTPTFTATFFYSSTPAHTFTATPTATLPLPTATQIMPSSTPTPQASGYPPPVTNTPFPTSPGYP